MTYDFLIIGAGIIGLTTAKELLSQFPNARIGILEKEKSPGLHASGRNSGVLHSGIYYPSETLKAQVCAQGAEKMRDFAKEHNIDCKKEGKVIIATSDKDLVVIKQLVKNAEENKINFELLNEDDIKKIEPHSNPYQLGIYSPDTAVINSLAVVLKLNDLLSDNGIDIIYRENIKNISPANKMLWTQNRKYNYGFLINCAGSNADIIAHKFDVGKEYSLLPFKGLYYKLSAKANNFVNSSIYPVPDVKLPFLGIHLTRVVNGDVYVGPTAIPAFGRENYGLFKGIKFNEGLSISRRLAAMYINDNKNFRLLVNTEMKKYLKPFFLKETRKLVPEVNSSDLEFSNKVGIRPQLINLRKKTLEMDYIIEKTESSIHVMNSISPAFTSSFSFSKLLVSKI